MVTFANRTILMLVQNLPVPFDRRVWMEALALASNGAEVHIICPDAPNFPVGRFEIEGVFIHRYKQAMEADSPIGYVSEYFVSLTRMRRLIKQLLAEIKFDLVHFCNPPDLLALLALELKIKHKSRVIFDQHDLGPELVGAKNFPLTKMLTEIALLMEKVAYKTADVVIATNQSYLQNALARGRKSTRDVFIVRSGPKRHWADDAEYSASWRAGRKFQVGYLGVMGSQEGVDLLLSCVQILLRDYKLDLQLVLVGSGTELSALKELSDELGISQNVTFLGRVSDFDLKSAIFSSDVCVNPDRWSDLNNLSTMNKIMEYMSLGKPIVQFDLQEGRYSALDASLYIEPDNVESLARGINDLLKDEALRKRMSEYAVERFVNELCWETQVQSLLDAYSRALK